MFLCVRDKVLTISRQIIAEGNPPTDPFSLAPEMGHRACGAFRNDISLKFTEHREKPEQHLARSGGGIQLLAQRHQIRASFREPLTNEDRVSRGPRQPGE